MLIPSKFIYTVVGMKFLCLCCALQLVFLNMLLFLWLVGSHEFTTILFITYVQESSSVIIKFRF